MPLAQRRQLLSDLLAGKVVSGTKLEPALMNSFMKDNDAHVVMFNTVTGTWEFHSPVHKRIAAVEAARAKSWRYWLLGTEPVLQEDKVA